jgi:hypothetical protein
MQQPAGRADVQHSHARRFGSAQQLRLTAHTEWNGAPQRSTHASGRLRHKAETRRHRGCPCLLWVWHGMAWHGTAWAVGCGRACAPLMASTIGACCIRERPMACDARVCCKLRAACCVLHGCAMRLQRARGMTPQRRRSCAVRVPSHVNGSQCETVRFFPQLSLSLLSVTRSDGRNATGQIGCTAVTAARRCSAASRFAPTRRRRDHCTLHRGCMLHVICCMLCVCECGLLRRRMCAHRREDVGTLRRGRELLRCSAPHATCHVATYNMPRGNIQ